MLGGWCVNTWDLKNLYKKLRSGWWAWFFTPKETSRFIWGMWTAREEDLDQMTEAFRFWGWLWTWFGGQYITGHFLNMFLSYRRGICLSLIWVCQFYSMRLVGLGTLFSWWSGGHPHPSKNDQENHRIRQMILFCIIIFRLFNGHHLAEHVFGKHHRWYSNCLGSLCIWGPGQSESQGLLTSCGMRVVGQWYLWQFWQDTLQFTWPRLQVKLNKEEVGAEELIFPNDGHDVAW